METVAVSGPGDDRGLTPAAPEERWNAFAELYRAEHHRMLRVAVLLTSSTEVAQDVVQDAFVRLYRRWDGVRDPSGYLYRIVVNGCRSHHRRAAREQQARERVSRSASSVVVLGADELQDALASLPYRQRAALVLRFYADHSEAETAEVLGCRPGTVGSLVHRGLAQLKKVIEL
jgi:RNA polymerase sigma-70 factor (sigma-E family)